MTAASPSLEIVGAKQDALLKHISGPFLVTGNPDIASESKLAANRHGGSVDRGNRRLRAVPQALGRAPKVLPRAGQHDRFHARVRRELVHRRADLAQRIRPQCISPVAAVDRDCADRIGNPNLRSSKLTAAPGSTASPDACERSRALRSRSARSARRPWARHGSSPAPAPPTRVRLRSRRSRARPAPGRRTPAAGCP